MPTHNKISKLIEIKDKATGKIIRLYEAVGFLNEGEAPIGGDEMMARVANENGGAIIGEDVDFVWKHQDQIPPEEFQINFLVTNQCADPEFPRQITCFDFDGADNRWNRFCESLDMMWGRPALVIRRLPLPQATPNP